MCLNSNCLYFSNFKLSEIKLQAAQAAEKADQGLQLAELYYSTLSGQITKVEQSLKAQTDKSEVRDQMIAELQAKIWNGNFVWKITNFEHLFQQAVSGEVPAIHSVPFYSGIPGKLSSNRFLL